jgi:hypothetical protein
MSIDDSKSFIITILPPFSTERVRVAYTYSHQITEQKVDLLLSHHFNMFIIDGSVDNNTDYSGYPEHVSLNALNFASMAYQKNFSYIADLHWTHPKFNPDTSKVPDGFPVVYSNGDEGRLISPFCPSYWQWMTDLVKNVALLPVNHPTQYKVDGVSFDFEQYGSDPGHSGYFSAEYGFEDWTFNRYCTVRGIVNPQLPADQRFNWLVQQGKIVIDPNGRHTGDYYLFLSQLIKNYAQSMREQIRAINPRFLIGAYPSPTVYYLPEIQSGWSTPTDPSFVIATEMYYTGGASRIPTGLNNHKLPEGYYDLTDIYPSHTSTDNPIYAYYIGGIVIMYDSTYYFSNDYAYNTYNLSKETNGYFVFTTYSLTETYDNLTDYYRIWCYDVDTNSIIRPTSATQYTQEMQRYYDQMDIMYSELQKYLQDPTYISPLTPTTPPPIVYEPPTIIPFPSIAPIQTPVLQPLTYSYQPKLRTQHHLILYAQAGQTAQFTIKYNDYGAAHNGLQYIITDNNQAVMTQGYLNYLHSQQTITFIATYTGCYLLSVNPTLNGCFHIIDTNIPIAIYNDDEVHTLYYVTGNKYNLYFWVETEPTITLNIRGQNPQEGAAVSIYRQSLLGPGYILFASGTTTPEQTAITFDLQILPDAQKTIWKIEVTKPANQVLEDVWVSSPQKNLFYFTDDQRYCLK